jgi:D-glycerate 3-kinase
MNQEQRSCLKLDSLVAQGTESEFYPELLTEVISVCHSLGFKEQDAIVSTLEKLWLPVALDLAIASKKLKRTVVQGILGGQGTGKSTLCLVLKEILSYLGCSTGNLSLDDLYLTYDERQELQQQEPSLKWRGPPGTHDLALGMEIIEQCLDEDFTAQISLPRFDKSFHNGEGDRTEPEIIDKPDILLLEGWFVGVQPIDIEKALFNNCPPPIVTEADRQFAIANNQRLQAYVPLWSKLDSLIVLSPEDYRLSKEWRKEAEHKMIALGKDGMSDQEIDRFVEYFWKALHPELFIQPLTKTADLVVEIKSDHTLGRIYRPANPLSAL